MGINRKVGIGILSFMGTIALLILFGHFFGVNAAGVALLILFAAFLLYIGTIAAVFDADPMIWTGKKIEKWLDRLKED
jgi:hypothetical protein